MSDCDGRSLEGSWESPQDLHNIQWQLCITFNNPFKHPHFHNSLILKLKSHTKTLTKHSAPPLQAMEEILVICRCAEGYYKMLKGGEGQLPFIKSHLHMKCCVYVVCKDAKLLADGG